MPGINNNRLFFAIQLPEYINDKLIQIQDKLKKCEADAKWVEPQNIHLTLKFLGNVPEEKTIDLIKTANDLFSSQKNSQFGSVNWDILL